MFNRRTLAIVLVLVLSAAGAHAQPSPQGAATQPQEDWYLSLVDRVRLYGHRNWIAIVDSAYPAQTSPGVETYATGADQLFVVKTVLATLALHRHVRPVIYLDAELDHVPEADAPGIDKYRIALAKELGDRKATKLPHAQIIDRLDAAGEKFRVLVLKTDLALPYTSVFIELDCGYWTPEAELRLRAAMGTAAK